MLWDQPFIIGWRQIGSGLEIVAQRHLRHKRSDGEREKLIEKGAEKIDNCFGVRKYIIAL